MIAWARMRNLILDLILLSLCVNRSTEGSDHSKRSSLYHVHHIITCEEKNVRQEFVVSHSSSDCWVEISLLSLRTTSIDYLRWSKRMKQKQMEANVSVQVHYEWQLYLISKHLFFHVPAVQKERIRCNNPHWIRRSIWWSCFSANRGRIESNDGNTFFSALCHPMSKNRFSPSSIFSQRCWRINRERLGKTKRIIVVGDWNNAVQYHHFLYTVTGWERLYCFSVLLLAMSLLLSTWLSVSSLHADRFSIVSHWTTLKPSVTKVTVFPAVSPVIHVQVHCIAAVVLAVIDIDAHPCTSQVNPVVSVANAWISTISASIGDAFDVSHFGHRAHWIPEARRAASVLEPVAMASVNLPRQMRRPARIHSTVPMNWYVVLASVKIRWADVMINSFFFLSCIFQRFQSSIE